MLHRSTPQVASLVSGGSLRRGIALAVAIALSTSSGSLARVAATEDELLAVTPEMASFVRSRIRDSTVRSARLQLLLEAIFDPKGLGIVYGNERTRTARETFEERSGNCLSFTVLFVALARSVGLDAYFEEVAEVTSQDQRGGLTVNNRHMFAEVELHNGTHQVDFLPGSDKRYYRVQRVSDRRVLAHYYNNLGAERLVDGDVEAAIGFIERAIETDEGFGAAWVNLGVARRRQGDVAAAEKALLHAVEIESEPAPAMTNLAGLYLASGEPEKAAPWERRAEGHLQRNPFYHLRLGRSARDAGDAQAAVRHMRNAVGRLPDDAGLRIELADALAAAGRPDAALAELQQALLLSPSAEEQQRIEEQLGSLGG